MRTALAATLALLTLALPLHAALELPAACLPPLGTPPTIDGTIVEAEWAGALRNLGLNSQHDMKLSAREATFWVGASADTLYLALKMELPPCGDLLTRAVPDGDRDIPAVLHDDTVELVIAPHLGATSGDRRYYHLIVNARGAMFDRSFDPATPQNPMSTSWRLQGWQFRNRLAEGCWEVEIGIPFASLGAAADDLAHPWGLRVCRNWQRGWDQSRWEGVSTAYEDLPTIPRVSFDPAAVVTRVLGLRGDRAARLEVALSNPGRVPRPVRVLLSDFWNRNPPTQMTRDLTVAPGAEERLVLDAPHGGPEGDHHSLIRVSSPDGAKVYYLRDFVWHFERPEDRWSTVREDKQAVQLQYAVYPTVGKLKVRVGIETLATRDKVTGARVTFLGAKGGKPLLSAALHFAEYLSEAVLDLPPLPAGDYTVSVSLEGEGVPKEPVTGPYERRLFPWEGKQLGLAPRVVAPFTPITLEGDTVGTVLRRHRTNGCGLWDQVTSLQRPLLRAPMSWVAAAGGQTLKVTPGETKVLTRRPDFLATSTAFRIGTMAAGVRTEWDQDGMAKLTVSLPAGGQLDRLALQIPLDNAQMGYLHACGDGLRFNYAGATPAGEGVVWDSSKANRNNLVGAFYPYLWVGGGERGLAWFADSDRGYSLADKTPALELERRGDTLLLRANLISQPTRLTAPRELVFGLQATPVKPMPEKPVNWRRWLTSYPQPGVQPFTIYGATFYYGANAYNFSPLDEDLSIYRAFSEARNTGVFNEPFVKQWLEKYKRYTQPGSERWRFFEAHINSGMRTASGTPRSQGWLLTPYTNPRGMGFDQAEWPSFQDEWLQFPYFARQKSGEVSYDVCPVKSFQDAALWHYREMMACCDGIYWDNLYLSSNFNTITGGAWTDEQGRLHPSMGLWAMRDLVKRTAYLFNEEGRPVFSNVIHMTNACLVPVMAFANINLDWEWQYGNQDFQERFTPELTVAETIGRQCGNIPLILSGGMRPESDDQKAWLNRTRTGVCLVHELRAWDWQPKEMWDLYCKLFDFGYGAGAAVYNYWDEGFPLKIGGLHGKAIVMSRDGKALVVVTDYGGGGECTLALDGARLRLAPGAKPKDLETGEALASSGPGQAHFTLRKHDYRAVVWE